MLVTAPHESLRPYIANYTFTCPGDMPVGQVVLPSASCTLVYSAASGGIVGGLRGVNTKPVRIDGYARQFPFMVLVEFHPAGLYPFLGVSQSELLDRGFLFGELDKGLDRKIRQAIYSAKDIKALQDALDGIFIAGFHPGGVNPVLKHAMERVLTGRGMLATEPLAKEVFYSEKQLNRLFQRHIGTGVKAFSRIVRMKHVVDRVGQSRLALGQLSEEMGYYDPSHFTRDFKAVCGMTPGAYRDKMSLFYNDPFKLGAVE